MCPAELSVSKARAFLSKGFELNAYLGRLPMHASATKLLGLVEACFATINCDEHNGHAVRGY